MTRPLGELLRPGDPLDELDAAWEAAWQATDADLLAICAARMAMLLGHEPTIAEMTPEERARLAAWPTDPTFSPAERAALDLTEQYLIDVSSASDAQVATLGEHLGPAHLIDFANALLVVEQRMRLELGLSRIFAGPV